MPGNRLSPRWILQMRFCRSSSLTVRLPSLASEKELLRSRPRVRGNSKVDLDTHPPNEVTMRRVNLNRKRNEKGNALIELAVVSIVIIPLFFGMVGIGINLGHMNQAVQSSRDVGHMYAKGVDFSQAGNQNIVIDLATGTGITTTGGNGVVTLSQVIQVYQADCNAAGYSSSQCTNLGQLVFINRIVIGNSGLRASNYGTPTSSIVNSSGNIAARSEE